MNRAAFTFLSLLIMLTSACTAQTVSQFRDPKTGLIVEECLRDPQGWGGIFADVSKGNEYADCKTRAESLGLERVK